jgi:hypothetical protein
MGILRMFDNRTKTHGQDAGATEDVQLPPAI